MAALTTLSIVLRVGVALLSIFLFAVVAVAYRRRPTTRMALITLAFAIFLLEGLILIYEVLKGDTSFLENAFYVFQFVELLVLAFAILKP